MEGQKKWKENWRRFVPRGTFFIKTKYITKIKQLLKIITESIIMSRKVIDIFSSFCQ